MPELPEVETVRRGLAPAMEGARIESVDLRRQDLRFPFPANFAEQISNQKVLSVGRRAKYLIVDLDNGQSLVMHLGMSGSFRIEADGGDSVPGLFHYERGQSKPHDHVVFKLRREHGMLQVVYNDPRRFGFMDLVQREALANCRHFKSLGVEPTGNSLSGEYISQSFAGRNVSLKSALLDQRLIAGLGNIYVCEALWRSGLSPKRKAKTISRKDGSATKRSTALAHHVTEVIAEAIEAGGSSLRDHRQTNGDLGYFQHVFSVYDQAGKPCRRFDCNGTVQRIVQAGRSTFYCPSCQR